MAQEVMKTNDLKFCDRPEHVFSKIITYNDKSISFSAYGDYWRQVKKMCTMELLTTKRVQSFRTIREEEVSEMVKAISKNEGSIVNLGDMISSMTYGITSRAIFGTKKRNQNHEVYVSAIEESVQLAATTTIANLYPSIGVLQMLSRTKARFEELHRETDRIMQDIVDDHKHRKRDDDHYEEVDDFVDVLLKFQHGKDFEYELTDDHIKALIQDMFVGGGETSSVIVEWAMSELIKNLKVLERAQDEVRRVYVNKGYVDESELHQLTYLKCIIKETLRLHPFFPLLVPRENREACQVNGYEIPPKSKVIINAWAIARDPRFWIDDAESFKPERFLDSSIDYRGSHFEFLPFGAGRRMCPGIAFATPNMELPLAKLLYHFDWKLPNGIKNEELEMIESFGITIRRQNKLCLIPIIVHKP
ncbi:hypothetical protein PIB30_041123 [Stylosanthes scabra]|uniref:Cytochrome P450 n=1 Tax=Stylosanthes scabra TaxID=79078 RepID=A0ABU6REX4_9FABA|nr:hypothetical protein [Stylosanthes scabra]